MIISKKLEAAGLEVSGIYEETDVESLGLLGSRTDKKIASFLEHEDFWGEAEENVKMIITKKELVHAVLKTKRGVCVVENPRVSFFRLQNYLVSEQGEYTIPKEQSRYGKGIRISKSAVIASHNVVIGNQVTIEDNVVIYENTTIEDNVVIRAGSIIGGEGFECKNDGNEVFTVRHAGRVTIKKGCEIKYNTCIDKALYPWDSTEIGEYGVLDNLVHIGHGVKLGKRNLVAAGSTMAGRTATGNDVWIGLGATVSNGLKIGSHSKIDIGSVVIKDVRAYTEVYGNPARVVKTFAFE